MKYLFYDLEDATCKGGIYRICEFGYVITDERYEVLERGNFIINPNIDRSEWDYYAVKHILTRTIPEYEKQPNFEYYYPAIVKMINSVDYVIGHTLNCDAKAINDDCKRYNLSSIDYDFYDVKQIYKEYSNTKKDTSVVNILAQLNIAGAKNTHDAETDAFNTMLELKEMIKTLDLTFEELIELCPNAKDQNKNYIVKSIGFYHNKKAKQYKIRKKDDESNDIIKHRDNWKRYLQFLDNVKPTKEGNGKLLGKKISISINYEEHHYKQVLNLVQMIVNEGGEVILKATSSDIFVKYDAMLEDGTLRGDSKLKYVKEANENGASISIVEFSELLNLLEITEEQLDEMPLISFKFIFEEGAIIKDKQEREIIQNRKEKEHKNEVVYSSDYTKTTLGELFGDLLNSFK